METGSDVLDAGCKPLLTFQETLQTMSAVWSRACPQSPIPRLNSLSTTQKAALLTCGLGALVFVAAARAMRRRRPPASQTSTARVRRRRLSNMVSSDSVSLRRGGGGAAPGYNWAELQKNSVSDQDSVISTATLVDGTSLAPQQLGLMGMEALETVIGYWEDALAAYNPTARSLILTTAEEAEFRQNIEDILEMAYQLQDQSEMLFIHQNSVLNKIGNERFQLVTQDQSAPGRVRTHSLLTVSTVEDENSFVSAEDTVADMRDFDDLNDVNDAMVDIEKLALYQSALDLYETSGIPYRIMRTEFVGCDSDLEFLAKLHCVRQAFKQLMLKEDIRQWWVDSGRDILSQLLLRAEKDAKEFLVYYDDLLEFLNEEDNMKIMEEELQSRNVQCINFYDICLDYILIDSFEDLVSPPSSVLAVMKNRWLSNGFKESAMQTAIWSVFQAKRRLLKYPNGFKAKFYNVSEAMIPTLAWAFFGPDQELSALVTDFKDQVMGFLSDIYDFGKVDYSSCSALSDTIMEVARTRFDAVMSRLDKENAAVS